MGEPLLVEETLAAPVEAVEDLAQDPVDLPRGNPKTTWMACLNSVSGICETLRRLIIVSIVVERTPFPESP